MRNGKSRNVTGKALFLAVLLAMCASYIPAKAEEDASRKLSDSLLNLQFGILAYIDYSAGQSPLSHDSEANFNRFALTRGYLTLQKEITPWLKVRMTTDVYQDTTSATGNTSNGKYLLRLKYLYGEFAIPKLGPITDIKSEVGMGHMPWLDFEEKINPYRAQGTLPIERAGIFSSADIGVSLMGNIGGKLEDARKKTGNDSYAGKWASWQVGVYNGGGYSAVENNQNKVVEGRLTIRPLAPILPGLQLSYFGLVGEGNTKINIPASSNNGKYPYYDTQLGMLSFENPRFAVTGQYFVTRGNATGKLIDANGGALSTEGYSFFANINSPILKNRPAVFGRYDFFDADVNHEISNKAAYTLWMAGVSYDFYKGNMLILDYQNVDYEDNCGGIGSAPKVGNKLGKDNFVQAVMQVKF